MQRRVCKFSLHQTARLVLCSWATLMCAAVAHAADWPSKPIRIIVPYVPGGSADMLGRVLAQKLPDTLKQSVVVENRPGFTGVIGSELVAKSTPDGYTLVISGVGSHVDAPSMTRVPYDPVNDFTHIALLALARVDGKSRVEYLDSAQSDLVRAVAVAIALEPPPTLEEVWQLFD